MKITPSLFYTLAFVSGAVGLAYEILFIRLLSIYFGDVYYVTILVLVSIFAGLAIGYWWGQKWARYIYVVEFCIAIVALLWAGVHLLLGPVFLLPILAVLPTAVLLFLSFILMAIPMVLVGASIPMLDRLGDVFGTAFSYLYLWYNVGAACWIVFLELVVLQHFGVGQTIVALSSINILLALVFWYIRRDIKISDLPHTERTGMNKSVIVLGLISVVSSIWYVYAIELSMFLFGPSTTTVSFVIAFSIFSISVACWLSSVIRPVFVYTLGILTMALVYSFFSTIIDMYSEYLVLHQVAERSFEHIKVQLITMSTILLPAFVIFGASVPVWLQSTKNNTRYVLTTVALGNMCGVVLGYTVFYKQIVEYVPVVMVLGVATLITGYIGNLWKSNLFWVLVLLVGASSVYTIKNWPTNDLVGGSKKMFDPKEYRTDVLGYKQFRQNGNDASIVYRPNNVRQVVHLGYQTLSFYGDEATVVREGAMPAVGTYYHGTGERRAFVAGLGTGLSVGAVSHLYDEVVVHEINPAMLQLAREFDINNYDLFEQDNVTIEINDAIVGIAQQEPASFDMVANITTVPIFFSSNKVHSFEFMKLAKRALKPGGVYVGWIDNTSGLDGLEVYNDTLHQVFKSCHYYLLNSGYVSYVCGDNLDKNDNYLSLEIENKKVQTIIDNMKHAQFDLYTESQNRVNSVNYPELILLEVMGKDNEEGNRFSNFVLERIEEQLSLGSEEYEAFCETAEWLREWSLQQYCRYTIN